MGERKKRKKKVLPRFELRLLESESNVITNYTIRPFAEGELNTTFKLNEYVRVLDYNKQETIHGLIDCFWTKMYLLYIPINLFFDKIL